MASVNKVLILGRLTRDPELRYTTNGSAVTNMSVVTSTFSGSGPERKEFPEFHDVVVFSTGTRKLAEVVAENLAKGSQVYVEGRIRTRKWENAEGVQQRRTEIVADDVVFVGERKVKEAPADANGDIDPDDIPF